MSKNLYVIDEVGATFVTLTEEDAQRVITSERALGLHVTALGRVSVPDEDFDAYERAVDTSCLAATEHPVFHRVEHGLYPTVWELLCQQRCLTGNEENCREYEPTEKQERDRAARNAARLLREDPEHPRVTAARERVRTRRAERDQRDR